jgi:hypothetical protein
MSANDPKRIFRLEQVETANSRGSSASPQSFFILGLVGDVKGAQEWRPLSVPREPLWSLLRADGANGSWLTPGTMRTMSASRRRPTSRFPARHGREIRRPTACRSSPANTRRMPSRRLPTSPRTARPALAYRQPLPYSIEVMASPPQFNTNGAGSFKRAVEMSDDELAAIAARAKLTVV